MSLARTLRRGPIAWLPEESPAAPAKTATGFSRESMRTGFYLEPRGRGNLIRISQIRQLREDLKAA